jgi:hypothetical protein
MLGDIFDFSEEGMNLKQLTFWFYSDSALVLCVCERTCMFNT